MHNLRAIFLSQAGDNIIFFLFLAEGKRRWKRSLANFHTCLPVQRCWLNLYDDHNPLGDPVVSLRPMTEAASKLVMPGHCPHDHDSCWHLSLRVAAGLCCFNSYTSPVVEYIDMVITLLV